MEHKGIHFPFFIDIPQLIPSLPLPWTFPLRVTEKALLSLSILQTAAHTGLFFMFLFINFDHVPPSLLLSMFFYNMN